MNSYKPNTMKQHGLDFDWRCPDCGRGDGLHEIQCWGNGQPTRMTHQEFFKQRERFIRTGAEPNTLSK